MVRMIAVTHSLCCSSPTADVSAVAVAAAAAIATAIAAVVLLAVALLTVLAAVMSHRQRRRPEAEVFWHEVAMGVADMGSWRRRC